MRSVGIANQNDLSNENGLWRRRNRSTQNTAIL